MYKVNWIKCEDTDNTSRELVFVYIPATNAIEMYRLCDIFRNITNGVVNGKQQYVRNFTTMGPKPGITHYAKIPDIWTNGSIWHVTNYDSFIKCIPESKDDSVIIINKDGDLEFVHIQDEFYSSKHSESKYWLELPNNYPDY